MEISRDIVDRTLYSPHGSAAVDLTESLINKGFEACWVGGCVRDMLLGKVPDDIDIATSAKPDEVANLFLKCDESSAHLGSVIVSHMGHNFEVTTFRKDNDKTDGRTPDSVTYCDMRKDADRRDITVNAIYWNPMTGDCFDPHDGRKDIKERIVRIIGNPADRLRQDALRLLRIIRFRSEMNGQYHPETFRALENNAQAICVLSGSRRGAELEKILLGPSPAVAFEDLWETEILRFLIPNLYECKGVAQPNDYHKEGDVWNHTMLCLSSCDHDDGADVRWAALLHDVGKSVTFSVGEDRIHFDEHATKSGEIARELLTDLQLSAKRTDKIVWLVEHHMMMSTFFEIDDTRKAHWYYHPWFLDLLRLFHIDISGTRPSKFDLYDRIISDYNRFLDEHPRPKKPLLSGDEVMDILGIPPGEKVGEVLHALKNAQYENALSKKSEALEFVKKQFAG